MAEVRMTDPETGGQKGVKVERFDLIPAEAHRQLALVYGAGAMKYDDDNWRKGYKWRWSLGALERHLNAWKRGENFDAELSERAGEPVSHLAAVMWHAAALMTFYNEGLGTDDIPEREIQVPLASPVSTSPLQHAIRRLKDHERRVPRSAGNIDFKIDYSVPPRSGASCEPGVKR